MNSRIAELKAVLPPIVEIVHDLKRKTGNEMAGPCPFCGGKDRFTVDTVRDLFFCRQCMPLNPHWHDIIDFLTRQEKTDFKGLCEKYLDRPTEEKKSRITGRYEYHDKTGKLIYWKERIEPGRGGRDKEFVFYHGDRQTGRGHEPVLYNLPDVVGAQDVIVTEGEKHADLLKSWGMVATTFDTGAQSKPEKTPEAINHLSGKRITILQDNDISGLTYARNIADALFGKCTSLKVILLPDLPGKGDIIDWAKATGNEKGKLLEIIEGEPEWTPKDDNKGPSVDAPRMLYHPVSLDTMLTLSIPERGCIIRPAIPEQGLIMVYGPRGNGKTWFVLQLAYAAACGGPVFAHWEAPQPRRVLYIDGEMPVRTIQERLASIVASSEHEPPDPSYLSILTPDLQDMPMPNLAYQEGQEAMQPYINNSDMIIVDNLACLARHGRENDSESWLPVQTWLLSLRRQGKTVIIVHHSGKGGNQRGTSSREDVLDTVVSLRRPNDYEPSEGARFEVHLEKARGVYGPEAMPFELALRTENGAAHWISRTIADAEKDRAVELKREGLSIREIASEMGLSKSRVQRLLKGVDQ